VIPLSFSLLIYFKFKEVSLQLPVLNSLLNYYVVLSPLSSEKKFFKASFPLRVCGGVSIERLEVSLTLKRRVPELADGKDASRAEMGVP